jgi:hypothetical protein
VLVEVDEVTGQTQVGVLTCPVLVTDSSAVPALPRVARNGTEATSANDAATPAAVSTHSTHTTRYHGGEILSFNAAGQLTQVRLGSLHGQGWVGDAMASLPSTPGLVWRTRIPHLAGEVSRLQRDVPTLLAEGLAAQGYQSVNVVAPQGHVIAERDGRYHSWLVQGVITLDPEAAAAQPPTGALKPSGQGGWDWTWAGLHLRLVPAAISTVQVAQAVAQVGATLVVQADGSYLLSWAGQHHALQIGALLTTQATHHTDPDRSSRTTGFGPSTEAAGVLRFMSTAGNAQTVYPAVADWAGLLQHIQQADPSAVVLGLGDGRVQVVWRNQVHTLSPLHALTPIPAAQKDAALWVAPDGTLYLPVGGLPGVAQGFKVQ